MHYSRFHAFVPPARLNATGIAKENAIGASDSLAIIEIDKNGTCNLGTTNWADNLL